MNKYLAQLVFEIVNNSQTRQFDHQLRWIEAAEHKEAIEKALEIGENEADDFLTMDNNKVQWKFIAITELYDLNQLEHGMEILSCITEEEQAENYIKRIRLRHLELTSKIEAIL